MDDRFFEPPYAYSAHLGFRMVDWSEGFCRFEMPLQPYHQNRHGNPHGGVHASLLDTVMGYAGCWTGDPEKKQMALTLSLNVMYLSRPLGSLFIAEGRKTGGGKSTFFAEGILTDDTGEKIASATGVFRYRKG